VFKLWNKESAVKIKESVDTDCSLWKLSKFIKAKGEEGEIEACKNLILKHNIMLKEIFINLTSASSFPAITMMTISNWVTKSQIA
jgi:hypothetical protein